jgi:hypothetical protein
MTGPHFGQELKLFIQTGLAEDSDFALPEVSPEAQVESIDPTRLEPIEPLSLAPLSDLTLGEPYPSADYPLDPSHPSYSGLSHTMGDTADLTFEGYDSQPDLTFESSYDPPDLLG